MFFDDATVVFNSPFCNDYFLQEKYCSSLKLLIKIDTDGTFLKASKTIIITYGMIRNEFSSRIIIGIILFSVLELAILQDSVLMLLLGIVVVESIEKRKVGNII